MVSFQFFDVPVLAEVAERIEIGHWTDDENRHELLSRPVQ